MINHSNNDINLATRKIEELSKQENNIFGMKSAVHNILSDFSKEEKNKIVMQISAIDPENYIQQNNLWFIVPHIVYIADPNNKEDNWGKNIDIDIDQDWFKERKRWMDYVKKNNDWSWNKTDSWQIVLDDRPNYQNLIQDWMMFNPKLVNDKNFSEMKTIYKEECINKLDPDSKNIIDKLSKDIIEKNNWSKITSSTIIPIPTYYWETTEALNILLEQLLKQDWDFTVVFYVNWSLERYDPSTNTYKKTSTKKEDINTKVREIEQSFNDKIEDMKNKGLLKWNKKIITLWNTYDRFPTVWWVKADMMDAIIDSTDENIKDPIIVWLDADVYEIPPNYITSIRNQFDNKSKGHNYKSFISAKRRWTKPDDKDQYLHFVEDLFVLWDDLIKNKQDSWLSITNGWTTSYRLNDVMKVKGIERNMEIAEDLALWYKINRFHSKDWYSMNMNVKWFNWNKLYSDPRRWYSAVRDWIAFPYQRDPNFPFKEAEKREIANIELNDIIKDILSNKKISSDKIKKFESDINGNYCHLYQWYNKPSFASLLTRFWNYNIWKNSQYKIEDNWVFIKIIEK